MDNDTNKIFAISSAALQAQDQRLKIIAENIANANTTASSPTGQPYRRQVITFKNEFDKALGANKIKVGGVSTDKSAFSRKYDPSNPAADKDGYVQMPNVQPLTEMMDMHDAQRSYEANLDVIEAARTMMVHTIGLLQ